MGVWYHYYSAPSDEAAAAAINRIGERLPPRPFAIAAVRSRLFAERVKSKDTYVETKLVDPMLALRQLEALLTGREYKDVAGYDGDLFVENEDDLLIVRLADTISAALADADDERLAAVVAPWSRTEEFSGPGGEPEELVRWLRELAVLARRARERSERLYCWYA